MPDLAMIDVFDILQHRKRGHRGGGACEQPERLLGVAKRIIMNRSLSWEKSVSMRFIATDWPNRILRLALAYLQLYSIAD